MNSYANLIIFTFLVLTAFLGLTINKITEFEAGLIYTVMGIMSILFLLIVPLFFPEVKKYVE